MTTRTLDPASPLFLALGFLLWASALTALYAVLSVGCELGWNRIQSGPFNLLRLILIAVWVGHLAALVWLYRAGRRRTPGRRAARPSTTRFFRTAALGSTVAAIAATAWIGLALPGSSMCI